MMMKIDNPMNTKNNNPSCNSHARDNRVIHCDGGPFVNTIGNSMRRACGITNRYNSLSVNTLNAY